MTRQPTNPFASPSAELPDEPRRCGWFDSTYELHCGLSVTEHVAAAEVAALVPLGWWLQWELEAASQSVVTLGGSPHGAGH